MGNFQAAILGSSRAALTRANKRDDAPRDFAKAHVLSGTKTRATLAVKATRGTWHDCPQFFPLVGSIPREAIAKAITGDSAYWSHDACDVAEHAGLTPYLLPKRNARWPSQPKDAFERMTRYAWQYPEHFRRVYHRRSTSESRNSTEKQLFGDRIRSRRPASRRNEIIARQIVHNVRLLTRWAPN